MKKFFLCCSLFVLFSFLAKSATVTWDGEGGDGLWSTATNWAGDILPAASDDVILDNSAIPGSYTVNLPAGVVGIIINSLIITPAGSNNITLILPNTNTASPAFTVSGPGDALILNSGSIFKNSSGAPSGPTLVIANAFRINNGGRYIHHTARGHSAIVSQLSTSPGTETGEFEFDVPMASVTLSLSGRTYGTLILSSTANGGVVTYSGTGASPLNIKGNLQINSGVAFTTGFSADIVIHQNLTQAASSVFNLQNSTSSNIVKIRGHLESHGAITKIGSGLPILELNGSTNQHVTTTGTVQNNVTLRLNNSAGITLLSPLTLPYKLELTNGKIKTDAVNILALADDAIYTGGSSASFVDGPMKKIGDDNFNFPVGTGNIFAPIGISGAGNATDEFIAAYKRQNPQSTPGLGNNNENPINHISFVEYWEIIRNVGTSPKNILFTVSEYSFAKNLNTLLAARFENGQWYNEGGTNFVAGAATPPYVTGSFESSNIVGNFGAFTIATTDNEILNPLPVKLVSFKAEIITPEKSLINWALAECCLPGSKFEIQKATESNAFKTIGIVNGNETNRVYEYIDNHLKPGINYYRLKMTDADGVITYSNISSILNGTEKTLLTLLAPTIVINTAVLTITSKSELYLNLVISDIQGKIVKKQYQRIAAGHTNISLVLNDLARGIYQVAAITNKGNSNVIRFIKQ